MKQLVLLTRGRSSAYLSPVTPAVRSAIERLGIPWMFDRRIKALAVPLRHADDLEAALSAAGVRVDAVLAVTR